MISIAEARIPAATIPDTAAPAASIESNAASTVRTASGRRSRRSVISVAIPSVPSEPTNDAEQVGPGRLERAAAEPHEPRRPGSTTSRPVTWLTVNPYLRQCAPPEFSATLPPIVQTCWLDGSGA